MTSARSLRDRLRQQRWWGPLSVVVTVTVLALVLLNLVAAAVLGFRGSPRRKVDPAFDRALALAYPDLTPSQRDRLQDEFAMTFRPTVFAQPEERPVSGQFVTVDPAGFRRGRNQRAWPPDPESFNVFVFGGSTAFGYGVRDEDTIASHLQAAFDASTRARPIFARGGFYSTQERLLFDQLLTLGLRPDLAIFIDGLNEFSLVGEPPIFTRYMTEAAREDLERPLQKVIRELPIVRLLAADAGESRFADYVRASQPAGARAARPVADLLVARYRANQRVIASLAEAYGVPTVFVWQPIPVYKYDLSAHPAWIDPPLLGPLHRDGYAKMRAALDAGEMDRRFVWCADIQDGKKEPFYVDQVHYNPALSKLVATCILDALVPALGGTAKEQPGAFAAILAPGRETALPLPRD
jgi:hypothetical protein